MSAIRSSCKSSLLAVISSNVAVIASTFAFAFSIAPSIPGVAEDVKLFISQLESELDIQAQVTTDAKAKESGINNVLLQYINAGGQDLGVMSQIRNAGNVGDALQIFGVNAPRKAVGGGQLPIPQAQVPTFEEFIAQKEAETFQSIGGVERERLRGEFNQLTSQAVGVIDDPEIQSLVTLVQRGQLDVNQALSRVTKNKQDILKFALSQSSIPPGQEDEPSSSQFAVAGFAQRMVQANDIINNLEPSITQLPSLEFLKQKTLPSLFKSDEIRQIEQAQRNFVNAILREESGAAIGEDEFTSAELQYFAQPGDDAGTLAQKRVNRDLVIQNFINEAGNAFIQSPKLVAPDGSVFQYDSFNDPDYLEDLNKGFQPQ